MDIRVYEPSDNNDSEQINKLLLNTVAHSTYGQFISMRFSFQHEVNTVKVVKVAQTLAYTQCAADGRKKMERVLPWIHSLQIFNKLWASYRLYLLANARKGLRMDMKPKNMIMNMDAFFGSAHYTFFPPTITWCHLNAYWPRALTSADKNVYHIKKSKFWTNTKFNYGLQRKKAHKCRQEKMTPKIAKVHRQTGCWLDYSTEYTWSAYQLNLNGCAVERTWFTLIYSN